MKTNLIATGLEPTAASSFRLFLQSELGRRCTKNSQYSLRAFAKYLGVDHASLSQLLRGKRALTARMILKLGTRLGLDRPAVDGYVAREAIWGSNSEDAPSLIEMRRLADDTSAVISEWHHYAILELTRLQHFKPDSRWIARVLGIEADLVNLALSRLLRLGLLEMVARRPMDRPLGQYNVKPCRIQPGSRRAARRSKCACSCSRRSEPCPRAVLSTARRPWLLAPPGCRWFSNASPIPPGID